MIAAADLAARLAGLEKIGLGESGTTRLPWTPEDEAAGEWFEAQAASCGLRAERDPAGNRWAVPSTPSPWWAVGSHTDSVRAGGRFDGALGVAAGFEVAARSGRPVAVLSFADEEGARYNTPTFGSRALAGRLDVADVLERADDDGVRMADALAAAGVDPGALPLAQAWLERLAGFVELHIDQSRDLAAAGAPAAAVRSLAARTRLALELRGRADHAGTTRMDERSDALAAAAAVIVRAVELAAADPDLVVTPSRLLVEPNAFSTVPSRVRLWLDARGPTDQALDRWRDTLASGAAAADSAARVRLDIAVASRSPAVEFDPRVRAALGTALGHADELLCFAGHDAGILAPLRPAGMVLVRNPTGISHSPDEEVDLADAAVAAQAVLGALEALA